MITVGPLIPLVPLLMSVPGGVVELPTFVVVSVGGAMGTLVKFWHDATERGNELADRAIAREQDKAERAERERRDAQAEAARDRPHF